MFLSINPQPESEDVKYTLTIESDNVADITALLAGNKTATVVKIENATDKVVTVKADPKPEAKPEKVVEKPKAEAPAPAPATAEPTEITAEQLSARVLKIANAGEEHKQGLKALLREKFGVERGRDVPPEKRAEAYKLAGDFADENGIAV